MKSYDLIYALLQNSQALVDCCSTEALNVHKQNVATNGTITVDDIFCIKIVK